MLLTEAKFSGYLPFSGGLLIFAGRGKDVPSYVVYNPTSSGYDIIEAKPIVYSKLTTELWANKRNLLPGSAEAYQEVTYLASRLRLGWPKDQLDLSVISKYPKVFGMRTIRDKNSLHQLLCVDNQMSDLMFTKYFGELEHSDNAEEVEDYKGMKIFFPSQMRDSRKKDFHRVFEDLKGMYNKHGLGKVITGNVKFSSISGNVLGLYYTASKEVRVDPAGKDLMRLYYTLIHEFAHKYYYEFIPGKIPSIEAKFRELGGIAKVKSKGFISTAYEHKLGINDVLTYAGKNKSYLKFGKNWKISSTAKGIELSSVQMPQVKLTASSIDAFLNSGFEAEEMKVSVVRPSFAHDFSHKQKFMTSDWFPTSYSMTNPSEWFAEMLTMYMIGSLEGDVKKYVESLI